MERTKEFRIHHKKRLKNKRRKYDIIFDENKDLRFTGKVCETPSFCDCIYCKNPKKFHGKNSKQSIKFCDLKNNTSEFIEDDLELYYLDEFISRQNMFEE